MKQTEMKINFAQVVKFTEKGVVGKGFLLEFCKQQEERIADLYIDNQDLKAKAAIKTKDYGNTLNSIWKIVVDSDTSNRDRVIKIQRIFKDR